MMNDCLPIGDSFPHQQLIFGACDPESMRLLLVVEAETEVEARAFVESVAPLLGIKRINDLIVVSLEVMPPGVPTFLKAFFQSEIMDANQRNAFRRTRTLH